MIDYSLKNLKPCPFCGGRPRLWNTEDGGQYIECRVCQVSTNIQFSDKEDGLPLLIERWDLVTKKRNGSF